MNQYQGLQAGLVASVLLLPLASLAQVSTYDLTSSVLTIPSVAVGTSSYTQVTLRNRGGFVFELTGALEQKPSMPGDALVAYDTATGQMTLPAVQVGSDTYLDVKLRNDGNFAFSLQGATLMPTSVSTEVNAFFRSVEALTESAIPASGTSRLVNTDACWANNGRTRASFISDWDAHSAEYQLRDAHLIGRRFENIRVRAVRDLTNPDGSARREIDVQSDAVYRDGTVSRGITSTLISGSSAGTPGCTTPQTGATLRELGNQRLVSVSVRGNNMREQRYALATGAALDPQVRYRREVEFAITDPMGNARYAVVTGPGPSNTTAAVTYPFSMKLLSARLLRDAPELQGKSGNFSNWKDDDTWRNCTLPGGAVPVAALVDCVANPSTGTSWGRGFTTAQTAAEDTAFIAQGWVEGGVYRFDLYNDDGWKTVGGHIGKTPVATYHATLERLPYSFVEMTDRYPLISLGGLTGAQIAANANSTTPAPLALSWTAPGALSGPKFHLNQIWEFHQGPKVGNPGTTFNPALRTLTRGYPGTTATSTSSFPAAPRAADQASKTYVEYLLYYRDPGSGNSIRSRLNFQ